MLDLVREVQQSNILDTVEVLGRLHALQPGQQVIFDGDKRAPRYETLEERALVLRCVGELIKVRQCMVFWRRLPPMQGNPYRPMVRIACGVTFEAFKQIESSVERYWKQHWEEHYWLFRQQRRFG